MNHSPSLPLDDGYDPFEDGANEGELVVDLFLPCVPPTRTAQQKRVRVVKGKPVFFHDSKAREAEHTYQSLLADKRPQNPATGAIRIDIEVIWPWRKCDQSTVARRALTIKHKRKWFTGKPDLDNFAKQFVDVLVTMRFIEDDKQVVELRLRKFVGEEPGLMLGIWKLQEWSA